MKKHTIISAAFLAAALATLSVLLYPIVAGHVNARSQSRVVTHYFEEVLAMDGENLQMILDTARAYNQALLRKPDRFTFSTEDTAAYKKLLNTGRGVMGILSIGKIDVKLPIYHGTDEGVLQVGLGHMPGTSLPAGGAGTHAFITGHRGLPSSTLLSNLDKMAVGDTFVLYVMGETLTYRVDKIQTVEPHEMSALDIEPELDLCTLVTCTPYGVNTHRLLVRGQRTENAADADWETARADARWLDRMSAILVCMVPVLPALTVYVIFRCGKIRKGVVQR